MIYAFTTDRGRVRSGGVSKGSVWPKFYLSNLQMDHFETWYTYVKLENKQLLLVSIFQTNER
jgi:hypothetical protein